MEYLTADEVRQGEFQILLAFDKFAQEHELKYSLWGGTLLGAVRHKGFIPWDDDIDVSMLRPEYDRLVALARRDNRVGPYRISGFEVDGYPMPILKVFDTRVRVREGVLREDIEEYLWIDVFPIDAFPSDSKKAYGAYRTAYILRALIKCGNYRPFAEGDWYKRLARLLVTPFIQQFRINDWAQRRMQRLAKQFGDMYDTGYAGSLVWGYKKESRVPASIYTKLSYLEFESHLFPVFSGWDTWLSMVYGNYMQLPPESERPTHNLIAWRV